jgi:uncharacterized protein YjdB
MKNKKLFVLLPVVLALGACGNEVPSSSSASNSSKGEDSSASSSSSDNGGSSSSSSSSSEETLTFKQKFQKALDADYSNVTLLSYQQYADGDSSETDYEYITDPIIQDYSYDLASSGYDTEDCLMNFTIDSDGKSWVYFPTDSTIIGSKGGWLDTGYHKADLSIWNTYFYLPKLIKSLSVDDIGYNQGVYYVKSADKVAELNTEAFGYAYFNEILDVSFVLDENNRFYKIYGFSDPATVTEPKNYVEIDFSNFGETSILGDVPPALSDDSKTTYWQYKGWPHDYVDAYYTKIDANIVDPDSVKGDASHDVVATIDDRFKISYALTPSTFEPWDLLAEKNQKITWHFDEKVVSLESSSTGVKSVHAIGEGETEIYASVIGKDDAVIESKHFKVQVNAGAKQDKTNAIYDFTFASIGENYAVSAVNGVVGSKSPFTISASAGVTLVDGKNSDLFTNGVTYPVINPGAQETMNDGLDTGLRFDFDDQQVSKISFNYGLFYASQVGNVSNLSKVEIRTSNDGKAWTSLDITNDIKNNISGEFTKLFEAEFAPASQVQLILSSNIIGKSICVGLDSLCFMANEQCHKHVDPSDVVHVTGVTLTPASSSLYVGDSVSLVSVVAPQNATDASVTYHVEEGKEDIVSISSTGVVTALKAGTAKVYATATDGDVKSNEVTIVVENKPTLADYVGEYDESEYNTKLTVTENEATLTTDDYSFTAQIKNFFDDTYTLANTDGESFLLSFNTSKTQATVSKRKYLKNGVLTEDAGVRYLTKAVHMTGFVVTVSGASQDASTGVYSILSGKTAYIGIGSITPSDANKKSFQVVSSNETIAKVGEAGSNTVPVNFLKAGDVTLTITDVTNSSLSKTVSVSVIAPIYPSDSNWSISASATSIEVSGTSQVTATFDSAINTNPTVTFSGVNKGAETLSFATVNAKTGLVTGKVAGVVVVTATTQGENGVAVTKSIEITITAAASDIPASLQGTWNGSDGVSGMDFSIVITGTSATLSVADMSYEKVYNFDSVSTSYYTFKSEDGFTLVIYQGVSITEVESVDDGDSGLYIDESYGTAELTLA